MVQVNVCSLNLATMHGWSLGHYILSMLENNAVESVILQIEVVQTMGLAPLDKFWLRKIIKKVGKDSNFMDFPVITQNLKSYNMEFPFQLRNKSTCTFFVDLFFVVVLRSS